MAQILPALLSAIRATNSASRVIVTSRYQFDTPPGTSLCSVSVVTLTDEELRKKLAGLENLGDDSPVDPAIRERAIAAADGNPRLLEWLDRVVGDLNLDADGLIAAVAEEEDRFREQVMATHLLDAVPEAQPMLARLNVVDLPVPPETLAALHDHPERAAHVQRAVALGLLEEGKEPDTGAPRYYVSNVLRPLLQPLLTPDEERAACATAAASLFTLWVEDADPPATAAGEARWLEVHRLAVAAGDPAVARRLCHRLSWAWLQTSRFMEVARLAGRTLTLGPDADAFYALDWARRATGSPRAALDVCEQALDLYRTQSDRDGEAATLCGIGAVYDSWGERERALEYQQQALLILREVGDKAGEATTLNHIGGVYDSWGERERALEYYQQALAIRRRVGHKAGEADTLTSFGVTCLRMGEPERALEYFQQALLLFREVGDKFGEATALNNIGAAYSDLGEPERALESYGQALPIRRQLGDKAGQATSLGNMAAVNAKLGELERALEYFQQAVRIFRQVSDKAGEAITLNNIGMVYQGLGEPARALGYFQEALPILRKVGDNFGEATTLNNICGVCDSLGELARALEFYERALPIIRQVGDKVGEAVTLTNIGSVYQGLGQPARTLEFLEQALSARRQVGDKAGEAATLNNIGSVYQRLGEPARALEFLEQALPIIRQVGDNAGEAVTRYNMALAHHDRGELDLAAGELQHAVLLFGPIHHPQLAAATAQLTQVRRQRDERRAVDLPREQAQP